MHSRLEEYLQQVETRLAVLPSEQRQSEIDEVRQHMEALVEAQRELGLSEEEAVGATLKQFGQAQAISKGLARAYRRGRKSLLRRLVSASVCEDEITLSCTFNITSQQRSLLAAILCGLALEYGLLWFYVCLNQAVAYTKYASDPRGGQTVTPIWYVALILAIPLLQGWITAQIIPRQAVKGTLPACGLFWLLKLAIPYVVPLLYTILYPGTVVTTSASPEQQLRNFATGLLVAILWTLLAVASAKISVRWKQARIRRNRLAG